MNVLILAKYGSLAASTRYRFEQFQGRLAAQGINTTISALLDNEYLQEMFAGERPRPSSYTNALARRARDAFRARRFDSVLLYLEAYPYLPPVFEWLLRAERVPYFYDFDDAIFHQYDHHPNAVVRRLLGGKIRRIIRGAAGVIAGNDYLARYAREVNDNVTIIPTVVDTDRYAVRAATDRRPLVVGWIGSPSTAKYVVERAEALRTFCARHDAKVVLVGSGAVELPGVPLEVRPWREENEVRDIQDFDIGIMPLPDTPWARGKCGFKLIQYMACAVPVVASPVGANNAIVDAGQNGLFAGSDTEWVQALGTLAGDARLRARFGADARDKVVREYSLDAAAPRLAAVLKGERTAPPISERSALAG